VSDRHANNESNHTREASQPTLLRPPYSATIDFRPSRRSQHTSDQALDSVVADCWRFEKTHPVSWSRSATRSSALSITQTPHGWQLYVCWSGRLSVPEVIRERRSVLPQLGQTSRSIVWSTTRVDFGIAMLHLEALGRGQWATIAWCGAKVAASVAEATTDNRVLLPRNGPWISSLARSDVSGKKVSKVCR